MRLIGSYRLIENIFWIFDKKKCDNQSIIAQTNLMIWIGQKKMSKLGVAE